MGTMDSKPTNKSGADKSVVEILIDLAAGVSAILMGILAVSEFLGKANVKLESNDKGKGS
jgi:hypothetical protein